jgi:hypothetical protein
VTIELHALCAYPAYGDYKNSDYPPYKLIKSIKHQPFNGYANIADVTGVQRKVRPENPEAAMIVFGKWAAQVIGGLGVQRPVLVPIPSSDHVNLGDDFTAKRLVLAINRFSDPEHTIENCLTQREAVRASSKGGSRKYTDIRDNLICHSEFAGEHVVLVDDVCTSGNHLKAAADILRRSGANVSHAICAGRTVWERLPNMFQVDPENIDWDGKEVGLFNL